MRRRAFGIALAAVIGASLLAATIPANLRAQGRADLLSWSTNGPLPDTLPQLRNPSYLLGMGEIQELLLELRKSPRDSAYVAAALDGTGVSLRDLLATPLLLREGERYAPSFPLLTHDDLRTVRETSERYARSLAERFLARRAEFERLLARYPLDGVARGALAYILIGCFSLDWDGLDLTEERGYRTPSLQTGVGQVQWATERQPRESQKKLYKGSHNETLEGGIVLTSFGDHVKPIRLAFPDLVWRMGQAFPGVMWQAARSYGVEVPGELRPPLARLSWRVLAELGDRTGVVMMALRDGGKTAAELADVAGASRVEAAELLDLLEALEYVRQDSGRYAAAIPVLGEEDRAMVQEVRDLGYEIMAAWFDENYDRLKAELSRTTPLGDPVPFEDTFYQIWHYVFGIANRILVEEGMFADPYGADRRYPGFIPCVWHRSLDRPATTGSSATAPAEP